MFEMNKQRKKISFDLNGEFVRRYCRVNDDGMLCPFLIGGKCTNFTSKGIALQREIRNTEVVFGAKGCDYVLIKILLRNKGFFIGHSINYKDGSNTEDPKTLVNLNYKRDKNLFVLSMRGQRDKIPFFIYIQTDYLIISQKTDSVTFTDDLCKSNSFVIHLT